MKKFTLTLTAMAMMTALALPAEAARTRVHAHTIVHKTVVHKRVVHTKVIVKKQIIVKPSANADQGQSIVIKNVPAAKPATPSEKPAQTMPANNKVDNGFKAKVGVTSAGSLAAGNAYKVKNGIHHSNAISPSGYFDFKNPTNDINKLVLGNKTFDLAPKKANNKGIESTRQGQDTLNVSHYLEYAKHGNYMAPNVNGESVSVIFYQGYETPKESIPTSGKAHYKGVAVQSVIDARNQRRNVAALQGKSEFDVDFAQKTIQGQITPNDRSYGDVKLAGKLQENKIIGNNVNGFRSMEGRFYGPNAEEISGRYDVIEPNKQYINGTFGAKKQ